MIEVNHGVLVILAFFILIFLRAPVFIALISPSLGYLLYHGIPLSFPSQRLGHMLNSFTLLAIPLFIFVGSIMNESEITDVIFDFANDVVGHLSGGLAQINIIVSLIFSGISGSALADIGGVGKILIEAMERENYSSSYSAALTCASATVGPIFPPSIPLIIYGLVAEVSVLALLLAGILPALIAVILLMMATFYLANQKNFPKNDKRPSISTLSISFIKAFPALATPVVLLVGMFAGYFGPTEAAAVTVAYMIFISSFIYGGGRVLYIWDASIETVRITGTILIILAGAGLFTWIMSIENVDDLFASFIFSISEDPIIVLLLVNIFLLILGMIIDPIGAMIMSIPIVVPPLTTIGYDPVHIGVIMVYNLMIGLLTPPLGISLFLASDIADTSVISVIRDLKIYYIALLLGLILVSYYPQISLLIPDMVFG